jgi:hypothetical protein
MGNNLAPASFSELVQFAQMAAKSQLVPKEYRNQTEDIMLAVQLGSEVGLRPMQALQNIAVINGRPAVWGDALPGLCKASPVYHDIIETWEHEQDADLLTAVCIAKRHGSTPVTARFSVMDAKRAGLWTKAGPWQTYPRRMLQMRPPRSPHNSIVRCQSLGKMREQPASADTARPTQIAVQVAHRGRGRSTIFNEPEQIIRGRTVPCSACRLMTCSRHERSFTVTASNGPVRP